MRSRNIFSVYGENDLTYVEPPPIQNYRAMELAPRLPVNDIEGTYPFITLWEDQVVVRFHCRPRANLMIDPMAPKSLGQAGSSASVQISLPSSWFYENLSRFG